MSERVKLTVVFAIIFGTLLFAISALVKGVSECNENAARCAKICSPNAVWVAREGSCTCDLTKVVK